MNCKNCGTQLVPGQIVCSNCDFVNEDLNNNVNNVTSNINSYDNNINSNVNTMNSYSNMNYNSNMDNGYVENQMKNIPKKQHIIFKVSSILSLLASLALLFVQGGAVFIGISLGSFDSKSILSLALCVVMLFAAYFTSNYNIGKSNFFDNKLIFIILLIITLIFGLFTKLYLLIFILNLIGFIITNKNEENY